MESSALAMYHQRCCAKKDVFLVKHGHVHDLFQATYTKQPILLVDVCGTY